MTLLNRASNGHVPLMVTLWRTARVFGPMPRAKLETLCRPRGNPETLSDDQKNKIPSTFSTWRTLGMFAEGDDDIVRLVSPFDEIDETDTETLRTAILDLLLSPGNSPALLDADLSEKEEVTRASDFVRVACWALAQDPYRLASMNQGSALALAHEQNIELFRGDGRWPSFLEWAYFVGLGVATANGVLLCPARAIREVMSGDRPRVALSADKDVTLSEFLRDLAKVIPVLDGGDHREKIDDVLRSNGHGLDTLQVSPCLSLALLQLRHEQEIDLFDRPADVADRLSLLGRSRRVVQTFSHIRRVIPLRARITQEFTQGGRV